MSGCLLFRVDACSVTWSQNIKIICSYLQDAVRITSGKTDDVCDEGLILLPQSHRAIGGANNRLERGGGGELTMGPQVRSALPSIRRQVPMFAVRVLG